MSPTAKMRDYIEEGGYQFLKDEAGWALYDTNDRSEVKGSRSRWLGHAIWASADQLGLMFND